MENGSEAGVPNLESKPSAHAPAPHARHDRSMARSISVASPIFEKMSSGPVTHASNVQVASSHVSVAVMNCFVK